MTVALSTEYSEQELAFLKEHSCEILSKLKLPYSFSDALPLRMFTYGGTYIGEIFDNEDGLVWAALNKFKGKYRWGGCYEDLQSLEDNF